MATISQIEVNGTNYDICDATARDSISSIESGTLTPINSFEIYSEGQTPTWYKWGKIVMMAGAFKSGIVRAAGANAVMTNFSENLHPCAGYDVIMHGSSQNHWLLTVSKENHLGFARYSSNGASTATQATTWLPFQTIYITNN